MLYQIEGRMHGEEYIYMKREIKGKNIDYKVEGTSLFFAILETDMDKKNVYKIVRKYRMKITKEYKSIDELDKDNTFPNEQISIPFEQLSVQANNTKGNVLINNTEKVKEKNEQKSMFGKTPFKINY